MWWCVVVFLGGGVMLVCKCLWWCCCNILYASCYCSVFKSVEHSFSCLKCDQMQSLSCTFSLLSHVHRAPVLASGSWSQWWCRGVNQQKRQRQAEWRLFWAVPTNKWASSWMRDTSTSLLRSVCHPSSHSSENFAWGGGGGGCTYMIGCLFVNVPQLKPWGSAGTGWEGSVCNHFCTCVCAVVQTSAVLTTTPAAALELQAFQ